MYVILFDSNKQYLETFKTRYAGEQFLLYRGRLFELMDDKVGYNYIQRQYVEFY